MWTIELSKEAEQEFKRAVRLGKIDRDDLEVIRRWHDDISEVGPEAS